MKWMKVNYDKIKESNDINFNWRNNSIRNKLQLFQIIIENVTTIKSGINRKLNAGAKNQKEMQQKETNTSRQKMEVTPLKVASTKTGSLQRSLPRPERIVLRSKLMIE